MNQKRYWLKWGIIVGVMSFIIGIFWVIFDNRSYASFIDNVIGVLYAPAWIVVYLFRGIFFYYPASAFRQIILITLNGFMYGAIIGWIYGKIKNRNKI